MKVSDLEGVVSHRVIEAAITSSGEGSCGTVERGLGLQSGWVKTLLI